MFKATASFIYSIRNRAVFIAVNILSFTPGFSFVNVLKDLLHIDVSYIHLQDRDFFQYPIGIYF